MKLTWKDPRAIAEELYDENPDLDPLTISFEKMHAMIVALPVLMMIRKQATKKYWKPSWSLGWTKEIIV